MKLAAVSLDIQYAQPQANIAAAIDIIDKLPADVNAVVLPELFNTSFIADPDLLAKVAETNDGPAMTAIREMASRRNLLIGGSFAATDGKGSFFNRGFMVLPDGSSAYYDKRHLFSLSPEAKEFTAGTELMPVVSYMGFQVSIMVCYDLRFPVWSRNVDHRYDLLLVPANWPISRGYAWTHLLIARAIENQSYVVGANRSGRDDYGDYDLTEIYDPLGMPIGHKADGLPAVMAEASVETVAEARRRLPAHFDADTFCLQ